MHNINLYMARPRISLVLAIAIVVAASLFCSRRPLLTPAPLLSLSGRAPTPVPAAKQRAALVIAGKTGFTTGWEHAKNRDRGVRAMPPHAAAARLGWASMLEHVIDANAAAFDIDVVFHTWDASLEGELVALYGPHLAAHAAGPGVVDGVAVSGGAFASIELALALVNASGVAYARVLVTRFDVLFRSAFNISYLSDDDDALFVANWCTADGPFVPLAGVSGAEGGYLCRTMTNFHIDGSGFPDFYFAGSARAVSAFFVHFMADHTAGRFVPPPVPFPHGNYWARARSAGTRVRRYLFHQTDLVLARFASDCLAYPGTVLPTNQTTWFVRGAPETEVSVGEKSECATHQRVACARTRKEFEDCYVFKVA